MEYQISGKEEFSRKHAGTQVNTQYRYRMKKERKGNCFEYNSPFGLSPQIRRWQDPSQGMHQSK